MRVCSKKNEESFILHVRLLQEEAEGARLKKNQKIRVAICMAVAQAGNRGLQLGYPTVCPVWTSPPATGWEVIHANFESARITFVPRLVADRFFLK